MVGSGPVPRRPARPPVPVALALALAAGNACAREPAGPRVVVESGGRSHVVAVEVADDDARRERGLMFRRELPEGRGMLFVFGEEGEHAFWMKDTLIPLQIAFWDQHGRIVGILDMEPCDADPCPTYGPDERFVGAVEANGGWFTEHGVTVGDTVELDAADP